MMNILVLGASGFIGNAIFNALVNEFTVIPAGRTPIDGFSNFRIVDFSQENDWGKLLVNIDLVINAIGIIEGNFDQVQTKSPLALYAACQVENIKIIHLSAIGAEADQPVNPFLASKKITDDFLIQNCDAKVVYPGVVIGKHGQSTQFFSEIAQFPVIPILSDAPLPLVHISQLTKRIKEIILDCEAFPDQVFAVAEPETMQDLMTALRGERAWYIRPPAGLMKLFFTIFPKASIGFFNRDTLKMLDQISETKYEASFEAVTPLIDPRKLIKSQAFPELFALLAISFIWIWSGISSLISWDLSMAFMAELGAKTPLSEVAIYAGSFADIVLGIVVFSKKHRKTAIVGQLVFMAIYMILLSVFTPEYWLHPFGVLSKNIPLIALSYYLYQKS